MGNPYYDSVPYLESVVNPKYRKEVIEKIVKVLTPVVDTFDTIAICGMSGALIGPTIADRLNKDITVVRKNDESHSSRKVEGRLNGNYIILDDIVDTGTTVKRIVDRIHIHLDCMGLENMTLVGVCLYYVESCDYRRQQEKLERLEITVPLYLLPH